MHKNCAWNHFAERWVRWVFMSTKIDAVNIWAGARKYMNIETLCLNYVYSWIYDTIPTWLNTIFIRISGNKVYIIPDPDSDLKVEKFHSHSKKSSLCLVLIFLSPNHNHTLNESIEWHHPRFMALAASTYTHTHMLIYTNQRKPKLIYEIC